MSPLDKLYLCTMWAYILAYTITSWTLTLIDNTHTHAAAPRVLEALG